LTAELDQTKSNINNLHIHSKQLEDRVSNVEKLIRTQQTSTIDKLLSHDNDASWDLSLEYQELLNQ